jgi:predicted MFS family arabinose efflux permease
MRGMMADAMVTLLRHREFRLLVGGQLLSTVGDRIVIVALALYVTRIGTPTDVGLVLGAATVPMIAFLLLGGVWADRLPRHRVMLASDLVRAALHALLAVLIFTGAVEIWQIVVIEALFGAAEAFFRPALTGLTPQTVPEADLQPAKAAMGAVETGASFAGPALATLLVLGAGAGWAFAADAATFLVSAAMLARMRPRARGDAPPERMPLRVELREGFDAVRSRAWVWMTLTAFSICLLVAYAPLSVLGPTVGEDRYGDVAVYGVLMASQGAGALIGSLIGFRWAPRHPLRTGLLAMLLWPIALGSFALGAPLPIVYPLELFSGVAFALFIVWWETALARMVPPHLLSRVTSFDWMGSLALMPIGYVLAGPLGESLGAGPVLLGGAVVAAGALVGAQCVRETRELADSGVAVT